MTKHSNCSCEESFSDDLIRQIKSAKPGERMTFDEFKEWIATVAADPLLPHSGNRTRDDG